MVAEGLLFALALHTCAAVVAAAPPAKKASFGVRARLLSGWPRTPPAAQSLEWLRDVSIDEAVGFLFTLPPSCPREPCGGELAGARLQSRSARTYHELLVRNAYYSPRIESLRTLERRDRALHGAACEPGAAWALLWRTGAEAGAPEALCSAEALRGAFADATGASGGGGRGLPFGFVATRLELPLRRGGSRGTAVLYGALSAGGLPSLVPLLREVEALASESASPWRVVFRHADGPPTSAAGGVADADDLTGYGFELAIKSSEYKTHADDEKKPGEVEPQEDPAAAPAEAGAETGAEDAGAEGEVDLEQRSEGAERELEGPVELDGLLFHLLLKRHRGLRTRLWAFKEQLEVERDTDVVLKAWEIKDLGLQAAAKIKAAPNPLLQLMRLSQNFPAQVVGLARTSVPEALRRAFQRLRRVIREHGEIFSVNGRPVRTDHSDLSLFPMMETLHPFFVGVERLVRTDVSEAMACELLKESNGLEPPERLDWRSAQLPPPVYLVTKDKKTNRWGNSLQHLLYGSPGGLSPVRMALYHVVYVFDPAEVGDVMVAQKLLTQTPLPISLHFVLLPASKAGAASEPTWDEEMLGKAPRWLRASASDHAGDAAAGRGGAGPSAVIAASFGQLLQASPKRARAYLGDLAEEAAKLVELGKPRWEATEAGAARLRALWQGQLAPDDTPRADALWEAIVSPAGGRGGYVDNATRYVASLGVPTPSMLVNGRLLLKGAYDGERSIYPTIGQEQQVFQRAVYMGLLSQEGRVTEFIASQGLVAAFHKDITPNVANRGGEETETGPGRSTEVSYLQWPLQPFLALPFLRSIELPRAEEALEQDTDHRSAEQRLGFFHVTVLRRPSHAYLLHTFASHLLAPDRAAVASNAQLKVPPFASQWIALVDHHDGEDEAMHELAACVAGTASLQAETAEPNAAAMVNRRRLTLLKFLGAALPAAAAADPELPAGRVRELCELAISKKIEPAQQARAKELVAAMRAQPSGGQPYALVAAAAEALSAVAGGEGAALWGCNGRQVVLRADGLPLSARHVQALELIEAQYDVSKAEAEPEEDEDPQQDLLSMMMGMPPPKKKKNSKPPDPAKPLYEWLAGASAEVPGGTLPEKAHGLVAGIRSEALSSRSGKKFTQPAEIFENVPPALRLKLPPARPDEASPITVYGIVDPLSATAQSASAVLALFGMAFNAEVNLVMNPVGRISEYPLKRYYREVIRWPERLADGRAVADLEDGGGLVEGSAELILATRHALTAAVHQLPNWLVTAYEAEHDMDNLRFVEVGDGKWCETTYLLRSLYVEGQAFLLDEEGWPASPAKGVQLDMISQGGSEGPPDDTIVMGNLGYFQVHGNPGIYEVRLKPGLSSDVFETASMQRLEVSSYITPPYQLRVKERPGKSHDELFAEGRSGGAPKGQTASSLGGAMSRLLSGIGLSSMLGGSPASGASPVSGASGASGPDGGAGAVGGRTVEAGGEQALPTIHIFSVASGHLYEKLLGIMILSVRNSTRCPLHFWFIDNFLSPRFKASIPHMAKRFDFAFGFVTYKWPSWLNPQSEKQRLIWAYKVLFLDVLFPLDVPKVIFIDADQVVRADVLELWEMDLQGKVYGWVPMGDTNPDTEGFRFWKQGYWKNHLGKLPYHIAALYVVDLAEYRRTSIGDQLRGVYNQLSRDPNSLSNLEQDLVNFAQHQIPIFSLPTEWLWCETWCSQESKAAAKTIDLCQNPLTKEPKIVMAKRIIREWQIYHDTVHAFQDSVAVAFSEERGRGRLEGASAEDGKAEL